MNSYGHVEFIDMQYSNEDIHTLFSTLYLEIKENRTLKFQVWTV